MSGRKARSGGEDTRMRDQKQTNKAGRARRDEREAVLLALLSRVRNDTFSNVLVKRTQIGRAHV